MPRVASRTITQVGYGDSIPATTASKLFTVVYIFGGISLVGAYLNEVMKRRTRKAADRRSES
jgi:voltage-gated potassium channel Kch